MGACAAFAFSRLRFKGRRMGLLLLMLVQMFPAVLAITAIYMLLQRIGDVFPTSASAPSGACRWSTWAAPSA